MRNYIPVLWPLGADLRLLREFEAVLIQLRPTICLASTIGRCLSFALAFVNLSGIAQAQTLWQTAPARPAPLPALVTSNKVTAQPTQPTSAASTLQPPRIVHLPPPPAYASRPASTVPTQTVPTQTAPTYNANQLPQGSLIDTVLPDPPSVSSGSVAQGDAGGLPPLPSFDELPLPTPSANSSNPPAVTTPFKQASVDQEQAFMAFGGNAAASMEPKVAQFQSGELVAVVGTEHILAGDMNTFIQPIIEKNRDKITSEAQEAAVRAQLTRQLLPQFVEMKAMYLEFFRDMVGTGSPKEMADTKKQVITKAGKIFFEKQVPVLLKKNDAKDLQELENKLRESSISLRSLQTQFIEQVLSGQVEQKYVPEEYEIDPDEIMEYYAEHRAEWNVPARARWRQVTARFDKFATRAEAEQAILTMGNEMLLGGKSFESVAKQSSQGFNAAQGGYTDWTSQGSLKSKPIDEAIFSLEPLKLSAIIEDDIGFHIVEVLEREAAHTVDLAVSQAEIRKKLSSEKRKKAIEELNARVMKRTPVWTRWPEDIPGSRPLSAAIGGEVTP